MKKLDAYAVVFVLLGLFIGCQFKNRQNPHLLYDESYARELLGQLDKVGIVSLKDGRTLEEILEGEGTLVLYFWATWCPDCRAVREDVKALAAGEVPIVGVPLERDPEYFAYYLEKHVIPWDNLVYKNGAFLGAASGVKIPSIPSWWVIKSGAVEKVVFGSKTGTSQLREYLR